MTAVLTKAGKELFERHLEQYAPADPMYEYYTNAAGKQKRRKRELPPGLSKRDANILQSVKKRAHYLDKGFNLCGIRFGWTFIIGFIPGVGDVLDAYLNYRLVVKKARQAEIPPWLYHRMLVNNAISAGIGFIPVAGDVFIAIWKANSRNAALLEEFLRIRGEEFLRIQSGQEIVPNATASTSAVNRDDARQVKPGAGREPGEIVEDTERLLPSASMVASNSAADSATGNKTPKRFWGWKSSDKAPQAETAGSHKGKFIENVSN